ncbi:MAG: hypothetical protein LAP40_28135, partial [Acidobacteriia bacterium]|nr:hypothetical protein [Terriglobia bacterium]
RAAQPLRDRLVIQTLGTGQYHTSATGQQGLAACPMGQRFESLAFFLVTISGFLGRPVRI